MGISKSDFDYVAQLAKDQAAIILEAGKEYLVEARLGTLAAEEKLGSIDKLVAKLRAPGPIGDLHHKTVSALTTNETLFFRDFHPFESLRKLILPEILKTRATAKQLTIWSAASSTGQEAYSIAMLIHEHFPQTRDWKIKIIGTDINAKVLAAATEGSYSQLEVNRGLPASYLVKYFAKVGDRWNISPEIKKMVEFRAMNLVKPWPLMPGLDLAFVRNVMIYFDLPSKQAILKRVRDCLLPHGYLLLGTAETTMNIDPAYKPVTFGQATVFALGRAAGAKAA